MLRLLALKLSDPTPERARGLVAYLTGQDADVLVLTAAGRGHGGTVIGAGLRASGYRRVDAVGGREPKGPTPGDVLVIGRHGVLQADPDEAPPGPDRRVVPVLVHTEAGTFRLVGVHGRSADPVRHHADDRHDRKRAWLEAFEAWVGQWLGGSPLPSMIMGNLEIAAPPHDVALRHVLPEEVDLYGGLIGEHQLTDLYDVRHPGDPTPSWIDRSGLGCRYDHAFATAELTARLADCRLDPAPRTGGLTDHSALVVDLHDRADITLLPATGSAQTPPRAESRTAPRTPR